MLPSNYPHPLALTSTRGRKFNLSAIHHQAWVDPAALDDNGILTTTAGPDTETLTPTLVGAFVTGGVAFLTPVRNVIVTVTHGSSIVACNGVITGTDFYDNVVTNTWSVTATGTSKTSATAQCFKTVTGVTLIAAADASANSIIIGDGDVLGLAMVCASVAIVGEEEDGSAPTAGAVVAGSTSANADRLGSYDPNSALNGALDFDLWYLVDDPQIHV